MKRLFIGLLTVSVMVLVIAVSVSINAIDWRLYYTYGLGDILAVLFYAAPLAVIPLSSMLWDDME